jgi:hypothetical protein
MPRPDDEWRSRKTSVHAGDQGVVAAMHIQHIKAVLVENRLPARNARRHRRAGARDVP